ncbi:MAG TPA: proprotein convertase P-domain-containing protein [Bacteroidia bacterium]|nr:proprotein convertase P-domain-containing protein [Bacteroidia bacterium]
MNYDKKIIFFLVALTFCGASLINAQNFPFSSGIIPFCDTSYFMASVSGVSILQPPGSSTGATLTGVQINVTSNHPQTLKIILTSPSGTDLLLAEFLGAGGSNYTLTNFVYSGSPSITTGVVPFSGNFLAQGGSFSVFDGEDPNGQWTITIIDTACVNFPPAGTGNGPWTPGYFNGSANADGGIAIGGNAAGPLPVSLIELIAEQLGETVTISWKTASEINNDYFDIERTTDLLLYRSIGIATGMGTTSNINSYHFIDQHPIVGTQYYRLKQVDYDGHFTFYGPVTVDYNRKGSFEITHIFKTTDGIVHIKYFNINNEPLSCFVYNLYGQSVYTLEGISSAKGENVLDLTLTLPSGNYIIRLFSKGDSYATKMFFN